MNFRMEISYFLGIMNTPFYVPSLHPPYLSFLAMGGNKMADIYCLAFWGLSLRAQALVIIICELHSGT